MMINGSRNSQPYLNSVFLPSILDTGGSAGPWICFYARFSFFEEIILGYIPLDDLIIDVSDVHYKEDVITKIVLQVFM